MQLFDAPQIIVRNFVAAILINGLHDIDYGDVFLLCLLFLPVGGQNGDAAK